MNFSRFSAEELENPQVREIKLSTDPDNPYAEPVTELRLPAGTSVNIYVYGNVLGTWNRLLEDAPVEWSVPEGIEVSPQKGPAVTLKAAGQISDDAYIYVLILIGEGRKLEAKLKVAG